VSGQRAVYLDSSALVKLAVREHESAALRRYLARKRVLVTSGLARTEVARALLPLGTAAVVRGAEVLARMEVVRVSDRILRIAGGLEPAELRSLDAIHLATAAALGADLGRVCTYDDRMALAAELLGMVPVRPAP
jgi:predicted nucleic acid-binding protein